MGFYLHNKVQYSLIFGSGCGGLMVDFVNDYRVGEFFSEIDVIYTIPPLQRRFVWAAEHIIQLLDDIEFHRTDATLRQQYMFIGNILLLQVSNTIPTRGAAQDLIPPKWYSKHDAATYPDADIKAGLTSMGYAAEFDTADINESFECYRARATNRDGAGVQIIDGQQRLTSLCILSRFLEKHPGTTMAQKARLSSFYQSPRNGGVPTINHPIAASMIAFSRILSFDPSINARAVAAAAAASTAATAAAAATTAAAAAATTAATAADAADAADAAAAATAAAADATAPTAATAAAAAAATAAAAASAAAATAAATAAKTAAETNATAIDDAATAAAYATKVAGRALDADNSTDETRGDWMPNENFKNALNGIIDWFDGKAIPEVEAFTDWFLEKVKFVVEGTNFKEQAYLIFRSLNSLGKGLTTAEKVKNDLLFHASKCGALSTVESEWNSILDELEGPVLSGKVTMDKLLMAHVRVCGMTTPPKSKSDEVQDQSLYKAYTYWESKTGTKGLFQQHFLQGGRTATPRASDITDFVISIKKTAKALIEISDPSILAAAVGPDTQTEIATLSSLTNDGEAYILQCYLKYMFDKAPRTQIRNRPKFDQMMQPMSAVMVYSYIALNSDKIRQWRDFFRELYKTFAENQRKVHNTRLAAVQKVAKDRLMSDHGATISTPWVPANGPVLETRLETRLENLDIGNTAAKYLLCGIFPLRQEVGKQAMLPFTTKNYHLEHIMPETTLKQWNEGDMKRTSWYYENQQDHALGAALITRPDIENNWKKIGNMLVMEDKLNLSVGKSRFQGIGKKRSGANKWDPYDVDITNSHPTPRQNLEAKVMKQQFGALGKIHAFKFKRIAEKAGIGTNPPDYTAAEIPTWGSSLTCVWDFIRTYSDQATSTNKGPAGSDVLYDASGARPDVFRWGPTQIAARTKTIAAKAKGVTRWKIW